MSQCLINWNNFHIMASKQYGYILKQTFWYLQPKGVNDEEPSAIREQQVVNPQCMRDEDFQLL